MTDWTSDHCTEEVPDVTNMHLNAVDLASLKRVIEGRKEYFPGSEKDAASWITQMKETFPLVWATHVRRRNVHEARQKEWEEETRLIRERKLNEGRRRLVELWAEKQRAEMEKEEGDWEKEKRDLERSVDSELSNLTLDSNLISPIISPRHQRKSPTQNRKDP